MPRAVKSSLAVYRGSAMRLVFNLTLTISAVSFSPSSISIIMINRFRIALLSFCLLMAAVPAMAQVKHAWQEASAAGYKYRYVTSDPTQSRFYTLKNLLSKSEVFAENKLFATLDTTTRKIVYEQTPFLLSDTVGFIRKLPHHLVESFKSTLDEVREADCLLHVVDISHPAYEDQMGTVNKTLQDIGAFDKPVVTIFNKMDLYEKQVFDPWLAEEVKQDLIDQLRKRWEHLTQGNCVFISATERRNIEGLRTTILEKVKSLYEERYPYLTQFY